MNDDMSMTHEQYQPTEADELRLSVAELNQSIAYLSKMVLQLQRSMNDKKTPSKKAMEAKKTTPETLH